MPAIADLPRADWHRLNRLLEDALALDETGRSDWLRNLPAADADLAPLLARLLTATVKKWSKILKCYLNDGFHGRVK